ncbi:hypothetical protein LIER_40404 [Lithospermum erythrorhizon]|uniref:Uncharacterized protein n=1 Tax=Lithospermum erythrorhizon TaxID=34254 RepID=A0AAV3QX21_LITER
MKKRIGESSGDTFPNQLDPVRWEENLFKQIEEEVSSNSVKSFTRVVFNGNHTILFSFCISDCMGEFLSHDDVILDDIAKAYRSIVADHIGGINFGDQGDKGVVDLFKNETIIKKLKGGFDTGPGEFTSRVREAFNGKIREEVKEVERTRDTFFWRWVFLRVKEHLVEIATKEGWEVRERFKMG